MIILVPAHISIENTCILILLVNALSIPATVTFQNFTSVGQSKKDELKHVFGLCEKLTYII